MKETIEFKKEIVMASSSCEIKELNITHEYNILEDIIEGEFFVEGSYKVNAISTNVEIMNYKIPFAIAIGDSINRDSINLSIENFKYEVNKDVLALNMFLTMDYSKSEEEISENIIDELLNNASASEFESGFDVENSSTDVIDSNDNVNDVIDKFNMPDGYATYKIHILKSEENLENVCMKYDVSLEDIKEHNPNSNYHTFDKIIIPVYKNGK